MYVACQQGTSLGALHDEDGRRRAGVGDARGEDREGENNGRRAEGGLVVCVLVTVNRRWCCARAVLAL